MRKLFFLLCFLVIVNGLEAQTTQDQANFNFIINTNGIVFFNNTSVITDTAGKKAWWNFGDGKKLKTHALGSAQHQYLNGGSFTACLRIFKYSPSGNDSVITGEKCVNVTIGIATPVDNCKAFFIYRDSLGPLTKWFKAEGWHNRQKPIERICWIFGDGRDTCIFPTASGLNFSVFHQYLTAGTYNVCVKIKYQGGCESTQCKAVTVGAIPVDSCKADYTMEPIPATPTGRRFIAIPWSISQKKVTKICWIFGNGKDTCINYPSNYTGTYSVSHIYPQLGNYNVCVKIFYEGGCMSQRCKLITIGQPTVDSCFVAVNDLAAPPQSLVRSFVAVTAPNRRPEQIKWMFGDGKDTVINLPNPVTQQSLTISHLYSRPGAYTVCIRVVYAGGCVREHCKQIYINAPNTTDCQVQFKDSITAPLTHLFVAQSFHPPTDSVISYKWTFGDGTTGAGKQVTKIYKHGGYYEVCVTIRTKSGCERRMCRKVAVPGPNLAVLHLSPNPVINNLNVMFQSNRAEVVSVRIYNSMGVIIKSFTQNAVSGMNTWTYNVSALTPGAYSVVVQSPHQFATAIFFKRN